MLDAVKRKLPLPEGLGGAAADAGICALASCVVWNGVAPFGCAAFAAGLVMGRCVPAMALGLIVGVAGPGGAASALAVAFLCAALDFFAEIRRFSVRRDALLATAAAAGNLLFALMHAGGDVLESALAVGLALLTYASVPVFESARNGDVPYGRILLLAVAVAGFAAWSTGAGVMAACALLSLSGGGAGVGAALSAGLLLAGADGWGAILPALIGAAAPAADGHGFGTRAAILSGIGLGCALLSGAEPLFAAGWALASGVGAFLPEDVRDGFSRALTGGQAYLNPDALLEDASRESTERALALSDAFSTMADGLAQQVKLPDEQQLIQSMRKTLCTGCGGYGACWAEGDGKAVTFLCQLISSSLETGGEIFPGGVPPEAARSCRRSGEVPGRLGPLLREFAGERAAEMRRGASGRLAGAQMRQAAKLLRSFAGNPTVESGRCERASRALRQAGISTEYVLETQNRCVVRLSSGAWNREKAALAARELSRALGRRVLPESGADGKSHAFRPVPEYRVRVNSFGCAAEPGGKSGDSRLIRTLPDGRILLAISDGMGTGEGASDESGIALSLLHQFLSSGIGGEEALQAANALLLSRRDDDMFATVDMCILNLSAPEAEFTKLAASRSLILRRGRVIPVDGGRLPLGVMEGVEPYRVLVPLEDGDRIIMGSDGVMDQPESAIEEALLRVRELPIGEICRALSGMPQEYPDDRTLICAEIRKDGRKKRRTPFFK